MLRHDFRVFWSVMLAIVVTVSSVYAGDESNSSNGDHAPISMLPIAAMSGLSSVNTGDLLNIDGINWQKFPLAWSTRINSPDPTDTRVWEKMYANPQGPIRANPGLQDITLIFPRGTYISSQEGVLSIAKLTLVGNGVGALILGNGLPKDQGQRRIYLWLHQSSFSLRYYDSGLDWDWFVVDEVVADLDVDPLNKSVVVGLWLEPDGQQVRVMLPSGELTRVYELPSPIFGPTGKKVVYPTILAGDVMEVTLERIMFIRPITVLARP